MAKTIKLKRCPFCGGKATLEVNHWVGYDLYHPGCEECDIWVESKVLKTAAKKWNTRITYEVEDTFVEVGGVWIRKVKEVEELKTFVKEIDNANGRQN